MDPPSRFLYHLTLGGVLALACSQQRQRREGESPVYKDAFTGATVYNLATLAERMNDAHPALLLEIAESGSPVEKLWRSK